MFAVDLASSPMFALSSSLVDRSQKDGHGPSAGLVALFQVAVGLSGGLVAAYGILFGSGLAMFHIVAKGEISSVLTMAAMLQAFAFVVLAMEISSSRNVVGVSARALVLEALALIFRLSSTTWLDGYIPVDASGDWLYQAVDICSLAMCLWLLRQVLWVHRSTYQESEDSFPIAQALCLAIFLSVLFHADMDQRPVFDIIWMMGLFVSAFAVSPQLSLCQKTGGQIQAYNSHYFMALITSRALSGYYMWHSREDIESVEWLEGWNHGVYAILAAELTGMLLIVNFAYSNLQAPFKGKLVSGFLEV